MNEVLRLSKIIMGLQKRIVKIQERCKHPEKYVDTVNKGSTGNYDPGGDRYWRDHFCRKCRNNWTTVFNKQTNKYE